MSAKLTDTLFEKSLEKMLKKKNIFGAVLSVEAGNSSISWTDGAGNLKADDKYFIASVTKLYVTAVMLILREKGALSFQDKIIDYFSEDLIGGLHVLDGVDYTEEITIAHLLSNTSGIPDYFYYEKPKGEAADGLLAGKDEPWPLEKAIKQAKSRKPKFKPGQKGKVHYSDTNYQLLGAIIEKLTSSWIGDVFQELIFQPLNLKETYAYKEVNDTDPVPFYYKSQPVIAPKYMASVTAEGGIVSTARENMIFLKAFFSGYFFPKELIAELKQNWNMIYFPGQFYFGMGLEKLWVPRVFSPFKPVGEVLGFWGQTGAFAFHNPETDLYFTGTINQASGMGHSAAYKAIINIIKSAKG